MLEYLGWSVVDQMSPFYAIAEIWLSCMCFYSKTSENSMCTTSVKSTSVLRNAGEYRHEERWCHCLRCCVSEICWSPAHDAWSVANWMVQVTRISYRWFVGLFSPYARLWGQLLLPGRQCSLLQSCYCQRMEGTAWRPCTAPKVLN